MNLSLRVVQSVAHLLDVVARFLPARNNAAHLDVGRRGEEEAYFYLRRNRYTIVARNFRSPRRRGEIDLVAWEGEMLCFIEVKTRSTRDIKPAEAAVDFDKQQELAAVAREFLRRVPANSYRFDVLSIYLEKNIATPQITLFKNAFTLP